ncbi:MAG TPA: winged helix-turn-helix domain-containing protein [Actinomycetales bacterium]|nr:winged helix-turn-helix domain-containing protein [Actinomycetales bacterium]
MSGTGQGDSQEPIGPPPHGPIEPGTPLGPWTRREADDAEAKALASGLRLQILRLTLREALTNKEIAARLGRNPASVLHHVRTLLATGFLVAEGERRGTRGAREVPYRATGKSWYMSTPVGSGALVDAFIAEASRVPAEQIESWRLGLRVNAEHREELERRLGAVLEEFAGRDPDPDGEDVSVFVALHPEPTRSRRSEREKSRRSVGGSADQDRQVS